MAARLSDRFDAWMARHPLAYASLIVLAACTVLLLFVDLPLAIWLQSEGWKRLDGIFRLIGQMGRAEGWVAMALVVYIAAALLRWRRPQHPWVACARWLTRHINLLFATLIATAAIIHLLKNAVARFRPELWYRHGEYGFGWPFIEGFPHDSFPSGHTQTAFAVAAVGALLAPRWRYCAYLVAGFVGLSRLVNGAHYLSDVVAGAFVSIAVCFALKQVLLDPARAWPSETPVDWLLAWHRRRPSR